MSLFCYTDGKRAFFQHLYEKNVTIFRHDEKEYP